MTNLFGNGLNYVSFSIMGMLIVFAGLTIISVYIVLLPKILNLPKAFTAKKEKVQPKAVSPLPTLDQEIMLAITVALHLDQTASGKLEKITWKRHGESESGWLIAGRMRGLAVRSHLPDRRS